MKMNTRNYSTSLDRMLGMNRVFDQAFNATLGNSRMWVPALDVLERGDAYNILVELPGVNPEQVELRFEQNVLTIRGSKPSVVESPADGELRVFAAERVHGSFERSIRLPEYVDADRIDAPYANGLLTITIPKAQAAQPRKISIRTQV